MDVRMFTVGPVAENCFFARASADAREAVVFDPGDDADKLIAAIEGLELDVKAILLTHTHFDHIGAVAPVARATGAPVYCPEIEKDVLEDINAYVPWQGFGPFENYTADRLLAGGETLELAGMTFDVVFTPGHSPGHMTFATPGALFSGDVLFQGSVGRTDLPFGDHATLLRSIAQLLDAYPDDTTVFPGHMGITTLGAERATNPFLRELQRAG
jgi:glyoxylase-like metal-dependent hydrolase (beta-lactamase superfamily II)